MVGKKKSDNESEKIANRVKAIAKERPSHKAVLQFHKDVIIEQCSALSKIKISPFAIDKDNAKEKIMQFFHLVVKKAFILDIPSSKRLFRNLLKILYKNKKGQQNPERITQTMSFSLLLKTLTMNIYCKPKFAVIKKNIFAGT